jgi:hypothetical protein
VITSTTVGEIGRLAAQRPDVRRFTKHSDFITAIRPLRGGRMGGRCPLIRRKQRSRHHRHH